MPDRSRPNSRRWFYIDANIYLSFYKGTANLRKLLPSLKEIRDNIFVTRQFRDEVDRNKLNVTHQMLDTVPDRVKWREWNLPELLMDKLGKGGPQWEEQAKEDEKAVLGAIDTIMTDVASSADPVSVGLEPVFAKERTETGDELVSARSRKERGNPPGKRSDPLGDQLSWTQLLGVLQSNDELWVVTQDKDYHVQTGRKFRLNAFLVRELLERGLKQKAIHVFDNLADALKHFSESSSEPVKSLPKPEVLAAAAKEERESLPTISPILPLNRNRLFDISYPYRPIPISDQLYPVSEGYLSEDYGSRGFYQPIQGLLEPLPWVLRDAGIRPAILDPGISVARSSDAQQMEKTSRSKKKDNPYFPEKPAKPEVKLRAHWKKRKRRATE